MTNLYSLRMAVCYQLFLQLGPGSWILISDIFPLSIRALGTSIGASTNWANNFVIAFMVPPMLQSLTWGTDIFFCVWTVLGGLFIWFLVPETKGKTLEEMNAVFGSHTTSDELVALAEVQQEVGLTALVGRTGHSMDIQYEKGVHDTKVEDV